MRKSVSRVRIGGEYALLAALHKKGVAVPAFTRDIRGIAGIGLPVAVVSVGKDGVHAKTVVVRYGDIAPALSQAARSGKKTYVVQCVQGHEVACGVMAEGRKPVPLVPVDLIPRARHDAVPHLSERQIERVQTLAKEAHKASGADGHSCVRCVVAGHDVYVTSIDRSPSLSADSVFMRSAAVAGITAEDLSGIV